MGKELLTVGWKLLINTAIKMNFEQKKEEKQILVSPISLTAKAYET